MRKVLIANRGEIAVRIARACRAADSYLDIAKILKAAAESGADAVHPGYGFLAENANFAREVIAAGLTWIGPPPAAIEALGDKTAARAIARSVGAPLAPGSEGPASGPAEAAVFAREHGLPIAIKAAYGGGGRGLKVAWTHDEIEPQFESAVREAVAAFGRGECFVERYLDRPRHVETQCLADRHGTIVVVSTRDCSLQRRHQKLVEEAPAPFLTADQETVLRQSSKAIMREAGYAGAGTCEFLIGQDGTVSFLEVNTRLQVEHPVTEEVSGIDLVLEMFKIADGQAVGYGDPDLRGHSIEFRINAEDPGRGFLPAPGTLTAWNLPQGPGVRVDAGYAAGMTVPQMYDSLIAKLIVTGADRPQALARARRALAEFEVGGMPTVLPFHRALLDDPAFTSAPFAVHTRWIETEFTGKLPPYSGDGGHGGHGGDPVPGRERIVVEVGGKRLEVSVPAGFGLGMSGAAGAGTAPGPGRPAGPGAPGAGRAGRGRAGGGSAGGGSAGRRAGGRRGPGARAGSDGDVLASPMQGTIVKIVAAEGQRVDEGETVVVLEAMKMEQPLAAHKGGTVSELGVSVGQTVSAGQPICRIAD